jgi:Sulfotransferase family
MIICPNQGFVFVHIPKCAGTSIRTQIIKCDPDYISLGRVQKHPVLGAIDYGHIPLAQLRESFPEYYSDLLKYTSYAIVRDPLERFGSALRQVLWQYEKRPMTLIPEAKIRDQTLRMLDSIALEIDAPSHRNIFFARQESFIYDGPDRIVDTLIPVSLVPDFISYLSGKTGTPMQSGVKANQNVELRFKGLGKIAYRVNGFLRDRLPGDMHARIKDTALKVVATNRNAAEASGVLDMPEVQDFVTQHYARDIEIYRMVMAQEAALLSALASGDLGHVDQMSEKLQEKSS